MTKANYVQRGESLDYTNSTNKTIPAGVIVEIGDHIGVTGTDIAPGAVGSVHVVGVFEIAKSDPSEAIEQGANVCFDGSGITAATGEAEASGEGEGEGTEAEDTATAAAAVVGYAAAPSAAGDETVAVKLCG